MAAAPKQSLWSDEGSDSESSAEEDEGNLKINKQFAEYYNESRRRRELARARELGLLQDDDDGEGGGAGSTAGGDDSDDDSSSDDDSDAGGGIGELEFMRTLQSIRKKDPKIYDPTAEWFSEAGGDEAARPKAKQEKKLTVHDLVRKQVLEAAADGVEDALGADEDEQAGAEARRLDSRRVQEKLYDAEQRRLRAAFLESVRQADAVLDDGARGSDGEEHPEEASGAALWDGAGLLRKVRRSGRAEQNLEELVPAQAAASLDAEGQQAVQEFLQEGAKDRKDAFLRNFLLTQQWRDEPVDMAAVDDGDEAEEGIRLKPTPVEGAPATADAEAAGGESEDEADEIALEAAEEFERRHNFRFEEEGGATIVGHSRTQESSIRRKESKRKRQREAKQQRKEAERRQRAEETKRLVNLARLEKKKKLEKVSAMAGGGVDMNVISQLMEGGEEFDPEAHDKLMARLYSDDYYEKEDAEIAAAAAAAEQAEEEEAARAAAAAQERADDDDDDDDDAQPALEEAMGADGGEEEVDPATAVARARGPAFGYRQVDRAGYGLSAYDILSLPDSDLQGFVSLKRMAPYREEEWVVPERLRAKAVPALRRKAEAEAEAINEQLAKQARRRERRAGQRGRKRARRAAGGSGGGEAECEVAEEPAQAQAGEQRLEAQSQRGAGAAAGAGEDASVAGEGEGVGEGSTRKRRRRHRDKKKSKSKGPRAVELSSGSYMDQGRLAAYGAARDGDVVAGDAAGKKHRRRRR